MIQTTIIPTWTNDRPEVPPTGAWMLPFVTTGYRSNSLAPVDPSITPILNTIPDSVEMWWRWKRMTVQINDLTYGFGSVSFEVTRSMLDTNEHVNEEKYLAKKEACVFYGGASREIHYPSPPAASPYTDYLFITAQILILPPKGTPIGFEGSFFVDESYGLEEGQTPEACNCLPRICITVEIQIDAGLELRNLLTNYDAADEGFNSVFDGHAISLNNRTYGNSVFSSPGPIIATFTPTEWFSWNGTWNTTNGERN